MGRKANSSLKSWVKFVKQVQKEEGGSYKEAMMSAKVKKDKGANWMIGGTSTSSTVISGAKAALDDRVDGQQKGGSANVLAQGAAAVGAALSGDAAKGGSQAQGMTGPPPPPSAAGSSAGPASAAGSSAGPASAAGSSAGPAAGPAGSAAGPVGVPKMMGGKKHKKSAKKHKKSAKKQKSGRRKTCKK